MTVPDFSLLDSAGLNLQAIFDIDGLPRDMAALIRERFDPAGRFRQLILVGHGGTALWTSVIAANLASPDPVDQFSTRTVGRWLREQAPGRDHAIVFPGDGPIGLQALGKLAGWHHPSPFMVGINDAWGSWYAYRAVALSDTDFVPTPRQDWASPCPACEARPCLAACPADALSGAAFDLGKCLAFRKTEGSPCRATCLARRACPVRREHQYPEAQMAHAYSISMRTVERKY